MLTLPRIGLGRSNPFPFRIGGGESKVEQIHLALLDAFVPGWHGDIANDGPKAADAWAMACAITMIWVAGARLSNQILPEKMLDVLEEWERSTGLRPAPGDSLVDRRKRLAARMRGYAGNTLTDITAVCQTLLGTHLVSITLTPTSKELNYQPGVLPGPSGWEFSSNRCCLRIRVQKGTATQVYFEGLMQQLDLALSPLLPAWMTWRWFASDTCIADISLLDETCAAPDLTPADLSGLQLWLRADVGVRFDGDPADPDDAVDTWEDQSANGRTCTQATGANQPIFRSAGLNGRPAVEFDGSNDFLANTSTWPILSTDASIMVVAKMDTTGSHCVFDLEPAALVNQGLTLFQETTNRKFRFTSPSVNDEDAIYSFSSTSPEIHFGNRVTNVNGIYENNVLKDDEALGNLPSFRAEGYRVGTMIDGTFPWDGMIAEIAVWDRALTGVEMALMNAYAQSKYGI